jgi:hypothetical protein
MARRLRSLSLVVGLMILGVCVVRADDPPLPPANLAGVRGASQLLSQEIGNFEQYVVLALQGDQSRTLYKQADAALGLLRAFNKDLKGNASFAQLYKDFGRVSDKIDGVINQITGRYSLDGTIWHLTDRIKAAREELRYNLLLGSTDQGQSRESLQGQVAALVTAVNNQNATVQFALGDDPNQADLLVAVKTFAQAVNKFQLKLAGGAMGDDLQESFAIVSSAYLPVVTGMSRLSLDANPALFRTLSRTDAVFERVFKLMQARGARPSYQSSDF